MRAKPILYQTSLSIILISCFLSSINSTLSRSIPSPSQNIHAHEQTLSNANTQNSETVEVSQKESYQPSYQHKKDIIVLNCPLQNENEEQLTHSLTACIQGAERELNRKSGAIAFVDLEIMGDSPLENFDQIVLSILSSKQSLRLLNHHTILDLSNPQATEKNSPNLVFTSSSEELLLSSDLVLPENEALNLEQLSKEEIYNLPEPQQEIKRYELPKIQCAGASPSVFIIIGSAIVAGIVFGGLFIMRLIKKKKSAAGNQGQNNEKKRFINSKKPSLDTSFKDFSLNQEETNRNGPGNSNDPNKRPISPPSKTNDAKLIQVLKLEDNGDVSAEPENVFTNIDNSPKSLDGGESPTSSVRDTPKHLDFKIEFSMIEGDSKIKSARTGRTNVLEQDPEEN